MLVEARASVYSFYCQSLRLTIQRPPLN